MVKKKYKYLLILLILITLGLRIYFAYQTPHFHNDSYFALRQVESVEEKGNLILEDNLSYGGRDQLISPLFYLILGFFNLFLPLKFVAKVLPNVFAIFSILFIYLLSIHFTKNKKISLISAFFGAFTPFFFLETFNKISAHTLFIPLMLLMIYCLFNLKKDKKFIIIAIILSFILPLLSISSLILIGIFILYLILLKLTNIETNKSEKEIILFYSLVTIWLNFLIFKNAFLSYGIKLIWQNIPKQILNQFFLNIGLFEMFYLLGIIPILAGVYVIYHSLLKTKQKEVYLLLSFLISFVVLVWLDLIKLSLGLVFLSIILVLIFAIFLDLIIKYLKTTKISNLIKWFYLLIILILIFNSLFPILNSINDKIAQVPSKETIEDFKWINENTPKNSTVLTRIENGHLLNFYAKRKNVADTNFLLIKDIDKRIKNIKTIYNAAIEITVIDLLDKYDIDYIYLSNNTKEDLEIEELRYYNERCFEKLGPRKNIYKLKCHVKEI